MKDKEKQRSAEDDGPPADVVGVLEELGERAGQVALWRMRGGEEEYCERVPADGWTVEHVREMYGGGKFRARIAGPKNAKGKSVWVRSITFSIAGAPRDASANGAAPSSGGPSLMDKVLLAIAPALVAKLLDKPVADPLLVELIKASARSNGPDAVAVQQLVELARKNAIEEGSRLGRAEAIAENAGANEGDSALTVAIKEIAPALVETMRSGRQQQETRRNPNATARVETPAAGDGAPEWVTRVRPYVKHMLGWADSGKTPAVKAVNILDDLSESDRQSLGVSCEADTFTQDVFRWLPELASTDARRIWFTAFLTELQEILAPLEDVEDDADDENRRTAADESPESPRRSNVLREPIAEDDIDEVNKSTAGHIGPTGDRGAVAGERGRSAPTRGAVGKSAGARPARGRGAASKPKH